MKPFKLSESVMLLMLLIIALAIALFYNYPMYTGLLVTFIITFLVLLKKGMHFSELLPHLISGLKRIFPVIVILGSIGALISLWMYSGVLATLLNYSLSNLTSINLVLAAFFLSLVISLILGTAIGTIGTIGTLLLALSSTLNVPPELMVGAIVSGAYFGDRTSPLSSSANLTASIVNTPIMVHVKGMLKTSFLPLALASVLYYVLGSPYIADQNTTLQIMHNKALLSGSFHLSILKILPVITLISSVVIFKKGILNSVFYSIIVTMILAIAEGYSLFSLAEVLIFGFHPKNLEIASLFSGSGIKSMVNVFAVISIAALLNGLYEYGRLLTPVFRVLDYKPQNYRRLMLTSGLVSFIIMVMTCNQSLPAIITGRHYHPKFFEQKIDTHFLSRSISDFSIILVAVIPWNINALLVKSVTNVSATAYTPYAFLLLLIPLMSVITILFEHKKNQYN